MDEMVVRLFLLSLSVGEVFFYLLLPDNHYKFRQYCIP